MCHGGGTQTEQTPHVLASNAPLLAPSPFPVLGSPILCTTFRAPVCATECEALAEGEGLASNRSPTEEFLCKLLLSIDGAPGRCTGHRGHNVVPCSGPDCLLPPSEGIYPSGGGRCTSQDARRCKQHNTQGVSLEAAKGSHNTWRFWRAPNQGLKNWQEAEVRRNGSIDRQEPPGPGWSSAPLTHLLVQPQAFPASCAIGAASKFPGVRFGSFDPPAAVLVPVALDFVLAADWTVFAF